MEHGLVEERIVQQAIRAKAPIPERILNAPALLPGLEFYYTAFLELSTCRSAGFGVGPIPWTAVNDYATRLGLTDDEFEGFSVVLKRLDAAYVSHETERQSKKTGK